MKKYKKFRLIFLYIFLLMIFLTGCKRMNELNTETQIHTDAQPMMNLNFRITWKSYSGRGEAIKRIVKEYNSLNQTAYQVNVVDGDETLDTIASLLNHSGDSSEILKDNLTDTVDIYMLPYRYVQYFGSKYKLDDLTEDFMTEKDNFYESIWKLGMIDGTIYGIPWMGHTMGLIYNKDLLDKAGVDPETINSLETLVAACETVEAATEAMGIGLVGAEHNDISWMINQFIYGFGGSLVSEDGTKVTINSDQSREALEFYKNVLGKHAQEGWISDTGVEVMDAFRKQEIAFEVQGLWGVTDIWKSGNSFETGVIPLDSIGLYPEVGPMMIALPYDMDKQKRSAAISFIHYLISAQAQERITDGEYSPEHDTYYPFRLPVRKDSANNAFFDKYPEFAEFLTGFRKPSIDVPVPLWQIIKDKYYAPGLHRVMEGQLSIDDFLKKMEEQGNQILNSKE